MHKDEYKKEWKEYDDIIISYEVMKDAPEYKIQQIIADEVLEKCNQYIPTWLPSFLEEHKTELNDIELHCLRVARNLPSLDDIIRENSSRQSKKD